MKNSREKKINDQMQDLLLKLPKDFDSLHTLEELQAQQMLSSLINNNLDSYYGEFFSSQIKTKSEVLEYIPEKDWSKYYENNMTRIDPRVWELRAHWADPKPEKLEDFLKEDKRYMVNTIDKVVDELSNKWPCKTMYEYHDDGKVLGIKKYYESHSPFSRPHSPIILNSWEDTYMFDIKRNIYIGKKSYKVSEHKHRF
jgi:hypothetical protein